MRYHKQGLRCAGDIDYAGGIGVLNLAGCMLVIIGCGGFAASICRDGARRLFLLKQIRIIYENLKYYIAYQKAAVPEALRKLSENNEEPFKRAFEKIYGEVWEEGQNFPLTWQRHMGEILENQPLTKKEKEFILDFPSHLGFMEENAQAQALDGLLREIKLHFEAVEKEQKSKNKMIMSLGVGAGVLISILLL